jgi:hypothetical protein
MNIQATQPMLQAAREYGTLDHIHPAFHKAVMAEYCDRWNAGTGKANPFDCPTVNLIAQQQAAISAPAKDEDSDQLKARAVLYAARCKSLAPDEYCLPQRVIDYVESKGETLPVVSQSTVRADGITGKKALSPPM